MPELTVSPSNANAQTIAPGRGNTAPANETGNADAASGTPASFAAVLKSKSEKPATSSGKDAASEKKITSTAPEPDAATSAASPAATVIPATPADPAALLALLKADPPAPAVQADASATATLVLTAAPLPVMVSSLPTAPATTPSPATAVSPAPTFTVAELHDTESNENGKPGKRPGAGLDRGIVERETTPERSGLRDKLAVETAIPAAASKTAVSATPADSNQESFRSMMDRMTPGAPGLATQTAGATGQATPPAPASLKMETPLGQAGWHDEMGQKLSWMVNNTRQQAELVLNPPHLGRIEVSLTLDGSQASASFTSPHAAVREALEDSMSRLRGVLADAGISLGQTHVGADPRQDSNAMNAETGRTTAGRRNGGLPVAAATNAGGNATSHLFGGRSLVDTFA
ncbi:MAG: flagellar hook-length control protein FliK [Rhodocyclales bacterium]|nr:flagellar hook-length control protein FliK [Rhodocyclales bacterium]